MSKHKIKKNLTDADMLKAFTQQDETFEEQMLRHDDGKVQSSPKNITKKQVHGPTKDEFYREFLTEAIETEIGKTLLAIKMEYFKEGVGDFSVHVRKDGKNIVLETAPKKVKK